MLIMGLPIGNITGLENPLPAIAVRPEAAARHHSDMHISFTMLVHGQDITAHCEIKYGSSELSKSDCFCLKH